METGSHERKKKKKRTPSMPVDKKYTCSEEGCGRSYSRAEHLYRHQLNHVPKQLFHCDYENCDRTFVRQDLCTRHHERHIKGSSQLARKDTLREGKRKNQLPGRIQRTHLTHQATTDVRSSATSFSSLNTPGPNASITSMVHSPPELESMRPGTSAESSRTALDSQLSSRNSQCTTPMLYCPTRTFEPSPSFKPGTESEPVAMEQSKTGSTAAFARPRPALFQRPVQQHSSNASTASSVTYPAPHVFSYNEPISGPYQIGPTRSSITLPTDAECHLPLYALPSPYTPMSPPKPGKSLGVDSMNLMCMPPLHPNTMRSDSAMAFASKAHLKENQLHGQANEVGFPNTVMSEHASDDWTTLTFNMDYQNQFSLWLSGVLDDNADAQHQPLHAAVPPVQYFEGLDAGGFHQPDLESFCKESTLSHTRRDRLMNIIWQDFLDKNHDHITTERQRILQGDSNESSHILSLEMMQIYIKVFWEHIHRQLPILHRPTFSPDSCEDLLLLTIMTLGASCLDKSWALQTTQAGAKLSNFLAWHLRHIILKDPDFSAPTKLWVFQALLLLEVFEKLYSTRKLHERAHVHHATTLNLMRRAGFLVDSAPTRPAARSKHYTSDEGWNIWINDEAIRRTAFAAYLIDITHATMFGHSAIMVAHEMQLCLPCDETIWSAPSGADVATMIQNLKVRDMMPITFKDGLEKTLNRISVRTNVFGRAVIMAGLLSIRWHCKMHDLRVASLGVGQEAPWIGRLMVAFDYWKAEFDTYLGALRFPSQHHECHEEQFDTDMVFESRTVLHHLARMAMGVDFTECQIFAGANSLLGRTVTQHDRVTINFKMKRVWAPSLDAREATFHAIRFLRKVLLPRQHNPPGLGYSARDDNLLNRSWVLYLATLVVWAYGFALEGPIKSPYDDLSTEEQQLQDMYCFLERVGTAEYANELLSIKRRNSCLGLLMLLRDMFRKTRWELMHEASDRLQGCIELSLSGVHSAQHAS